MRYIFTFLSLAFTSLGAQYSSYSFVGHAIINGDMNSYYIKKPDSAVKASGLKELMHQTYVKNKKGKEVLINKDVYSYFRSGHRRFSASFNSKGRLMSYYYDSMDDNHRIVLEQNIYSFGTGRASYKISYEYERNGEIPVKVQTYNKRKNKLYMTTVNEFKNNSIVTARVYFYNSTQAGNVVEYLRDSQGNIQYVKTYNRKGKLTGITNYTCNKSGVVEKKVEESMVCKTSEILPNGHRLETKVTQYNPRYTSREVTEYDAQNRLREQKVFSGKSGEIIDFHYKVNYTDSGRLTEYFSYDMRRGKAVLTRYSRYLQRDKITLSNITMTYNRKSRLISSYSYAYTYDSSNRLTEYRFTDRVTGKEYRTALERRYY
jgi:hypothetical protein